MEEINFFLRDLIENDPFCHISLPAATAVQVLVGGTRLELAGSPLFDTFKPSGDESLEIVSVKQYQLKNCI